MNPLGLGNVSNLLNQGSQFAVEEGLQTVGSVLYNSLGFINDSVQRISPGLFWGSLYLGIGMMGVEGSGRIFHAFKARSIFKLDSRSFFKILTTSPWRHGLLFTLKDFNLVATTVKTILYLLPRARRDRYQFEITAAAEFVMVGNALSIDVTSESYKAYWVFCQVAALSLLRKTRKEGEEIAVTALTSATAPTGCYKAALQAGLALTLFRQKDWKRCAEVAEEGIQTVENMPIEEKVEGVHFPYKATLYIVGAQALNKLGRHQEALDIAKQGLAYVEKVPFSSLGRLFRLFSHDSFLISEDPYYYTIHELQVQYLKALGKSGDYNTAKALAKGFLNIKGKGELKGKNREAVLIELAKSLKGLGDREGAVDLLNSIIKKTIIYSCEDRIEASLEAMSLATTVEESTAAANHLIKAIKALPSYRSHSIDDDVMAFGFFQGVKQMNQEQKFREAADEANRILKEIDPLSSLMRTLISLELVMALNNLNNEKNYKDAVSKIRDALMSKDKISKEVLPLVYSALLTSLSSQARHEDVVAEASRAIAALEGLNSDFAKGFKEFFANERNKALRLLGREVEDVI